MAKSKNHTSHNQSRKAHRNGLKRRGLKQRNESLVGCDLKYRKNRKFAQLHDPNIKSNNLQKKASA